MVMQYRQSSKYQSYSESIATKSRYKPKEKEKTDFISYQCSHDNHRNCPSQKCTCNCQYHKYDKLR